MTTGTVTAITTDWRGDTLSADVAAAATVLPVVDAGDFDPSGGWLMVGTDGPFAYTTADEDVDTVTVAVALAAGYEAGLPVTLWDPTVANGGAQVIEYVASVQLDDGSGTPDAVVPHGLVPLSSVENLIGASVRIAESEDGGWFISAVLGREASLADVDIIGARFLTSTDGPRVVVTPTDFGGGMLLYTDHVDELAAGQVSSTNVDLGALKSLITQVSSPRLDGVPGSGKAMLSLSSTRLTTGPATYETAATLAADRLTLAGDRVESPNMYLTAPPTTAAAANVNIGPGGQLRESTSSRRFKQDIEPAEIDPATVLQILGVTYRDRLEVETDPATTNRYVGVIAEELHDLGLTQFVTYDDDGPRAVNYERLCVALLAVVQNQEARLARIEAHLNMTPEGA